MVSYDKVVASVFGISQCLESNSHPESFFFVVRVVSLFVVSGQRCVAGCKAFASTRRRRGAHVLARKDFRPMPALRALSLSKDNRETSPRSSSGSSAKFADRWTAESEIRKIDSSRIYAVEIRITPMTKIMTPASDEREKRETDRTTLFSSIASHGGRRRSTMVMGNTRRKRARSSRQSGRTNCKKMFVPPL